MAHYVRADLKVAGIKSDLADYIQSRDFSKLPTPEQGSLQAEYEQLGQRMLKILLDRINRLVAYARSRKGQYWLVGYQMDLGRMHSLYQTFKARGSFGEGDWFRFQPSVGDKLTIVMQSERRYISQLEWQDVKSFVEGDSRAPLVGELLAGAEQLAGNGYRRSALTEAVTALEVAIYNFARSPNAALAFSEICADRLGLSRLEAQVKHLGLSGSICYLLPLILPEKLLPTAVISDCQLAIAHRQNVVHNGQRDVSEIVISRVLSSLKTCCDALDSITTKIVES